MVEQEAEILFSHDNVQLYFIKPNGEVTCSTEGLPMQIVRLSGTYSLFGDYEVQLSFPVP